MKKHGIQEFIVVMKDGKIFREGAEYITEGWHTYPIGIYDKPMHSEISYSEFIKEPALLFKRGKYDHPLKDELNKGECKKVIVRTEYTIEIEDLKNEKRTFPFVGRL